MKKVIKIFKTRLNQEPYVIWVNSLDKIIKNRIDTRINRIAIGNYGDFSPLKDADEIKELRLTFGAGYRIYFYEIDINTVLILTGGTKSSQNQDIQKAIEYLKEYKDNNDE